MCGLWPSAPQAPEGQRSATRPPRGDARDVAGGLLLPFLLRTPPTTPTPTLPLSLLFLSGARGVRTCVVALARPPHGVLELMQSPMAQKPVLRNGVLTGQDGLEVCGAGRGAHRHPRELGDAPLEADGEVRAVGAELLQHARGRP